jgi:C1A family cysteine protease
MPYEDEVDWRNEGAVNPIKDQGKCGASWAFSAVSAIESKFKIVNNTLYSLSEQQIIDCCLGLCDGC